MGLRSLSCLLQNIGRRANLESVLGKNPLLWCCPSIPPGDGLKYSVIEKDGTWVELNYRRRREEEDLEHQA